MPRNATLFIWFRLLFNCRFYYPVYTVLFLDFGLSFAQFTSLNVAWAFSIVLLDVPSGALADTLGRRNLVIISSCLMIIEMLVMACVPVGGAWVFGVFLLNRVLSGGAEAFSSGADEALAYDSIPKDERPQMWPRVMGRLSRSMAAGFIVSSLVGAFVYDAKNMNGVLAALGWRDAGLTKAITIKFPIYLNMLTAVGCLAIALAMRETPKAHAFKNLREGVRQSWGGIRSAGAWIWRTRTPFLLIVLGFVLDSMVRLFYTTASNYYRLIGIAEASFGLISTGVSVLALLTSSWMEWLAQHRSARFNFGLTIVMIAWGLVVLAHPVPGWPGVVMLGPLMLSGRLMQFFLSHYLNEVTDSAHRATVLSFKSLTMNLAYGSVMLLAGWQSSYLAGRMNLSGEDLRVFAAALTWWPWWFAFTLVLYWIVKKWKTSKPVTGA